MFNYGLIVENFNRSNNVALAAYTDIYEMRIYPC